ncbi:MAG TPA: hypothetical protein VL971_04765 [Rhizomicrobium sp.]|nr:hypothetical protein [Rhizomicrobium sp.]
MRFLARFLALASVLAMAACSHAAPPSGRWEGVYDANGTVVAARVEITPKGDVYVSAPDAMGVASTDDRAAIHQRLADGLNQSWGSVVPRQMDFDGKTFRKPGGIAPQMEWDAASNTMTLVLYLGTAPAIRMPLHPVKDFSPNPFPGAG